MLTNDELLILVRDTNKRDSWRREALDQLISNLAVDHLYHIVLDTSRKDEWRKHALNAICEIAKLQGSIVSMSSLSLHVGDISITVNATAVSSGTSMIANRAADVLYRIFNDTSRKDAWRYQCLKYLIAIRHKEHLTQIANNTSRKNAWRDEAMRALIHG